ncbi:unnamed protein product [Pleuronectes platessa]|uniref:Uncharacterized protein n=1 Tax=Pleuronectes platessa TaxID=8262 RepID=A0A9N7VSA9_PLEPL|nr:unnamed protein product [Pleuronectes platessa]
MTAKHGRRVENNLWLNILSEAEPENYGRRCSPQEPGNPRREAEAEKEGEEEEKREDRRNREEERMGMRE